MARAKWGPAIGSEEKWRFAAGDIVLVAERGSTPKCDINGDIIYDDDGHYYSISQPFTGVVVARMPNPPDRMFALVFEDGSPAPPDPKCKCYVVRVIPEPKIQAPNFFNWNLGLFFITKDKYVSQTNKEKRMAELGLWNNDSGVFDIKRLSELRNKVQEDDMKEKRGGHHDDR